MLTIWLWRPMRAPPALLWAARRRGCSQASSCPYVLRGACCSQSLPLFTVLCRCLRGHSVLAFAQKAPQKGCIQLVCLCCLPPSILQLASMFQRPREQQRTPCHVSTLGGMMRLLQSNLIRWARGFSVSFPLECCPFYSMLIHHKDLCGEVEVHRKWCDGSLEVGCISHLDCLLLLFLFTFMHVQAQNSLK